MRAYTGKVLWVDLTQGTWREEIISDNIYKQYLGGTGLGAWLLYRAIPPGADPLGAENVLGFLPGLLTGTGSLFTGRWMAVAKSPLTGTWGDANCGGSLALAIKQCGYDAILFQGISAKPVYLFIDAGGPQLRDASHLWGMDAIETEDLLIRGHKGRKKPAVATIGMAGEKLSLISGIVNDRGRLAARSGLGAVMGSKRLKAVVLAGARRVGAHDPVRTKLLSIRCARAIRFPHRLLTVDMLALLGKVLGTLPLNIAMPGSVFSGALAKWGTIGTLATLSGIGDTPYKNWAGSKRDLPDIYRTISPDSVRQEESRKYHCHGCPLGCGGITRIPKHEHPGETEESHKIEYETTAGFTTMLLCDDLDLVHELNEMLNRAGMDTISASGTVAFAMEAYEKGWITRADTGGLELTWGNGEAVRTLIQQMIARQGFGAWLSDGSRQAARNLAPEAMDAAIQAGGQEIAYHDPRLDPGMGLHASADPTPGRHTTGAYLNYEMHHLWKRVRGMPPQPLVYAKKPRLESTRERARTTAAVSCFTQFYAAMGACYFGMLLGVNRVPIFEWANAITGWNLPPEEYLRTGQRIQTLRQMFNNREGIDPWSLKISRRLTGEPPLEEGPNRGVRFDLEALMRDHWDELGWDRETGIPGDETLRSLDLFELTRPGEKEPPA